VIYKIAVRVNNGDAAPGFDVAAGDCLDER